MKKQTAVLIMVIVLCSCTNRKNEPTPATEIVVTAVDSLPTSPSDSLIATVDEPQLPPPASKTEYFDEFIYEFASEPKFQLQRTIFPLPYYIDDVAQKIQQDEWKHDSLFIIKNYYTLLLDREDDLELLGDTSRTSVQVEWMFMDTRQLRKYYFERVKGQWMLEAINQRPLADDGKGGFVDFFTRFASDSIFQSQHIRKPLEFITTDPDDDFAILETILDLNQWFAFKPELPTERLSNISYGQKNEGTSKTKIVQLKGIGNGFLNTLYFRKKRGEWEMYKFEDTSN